MNNKLISIIIPCYNEQQWLFAFTTELIEYLGVLSWYNWEIILVNDGSTDTTWQVIYDLSEVYNIVRWINFSRNFGKEVALSAGIEYATGAAVITMDSDGQHPITKIADFITEWELWYDIVYNRRPNITWASRLKRTTSKLFYGFFNAISEFELESQTTDYRLLDRKVVDIFLTFTERNRIYRGLIDWIWFTKKALIFDALPNPSGRIPSYNYNKLTQLAINSVTSFSVRPLKIIAYIGWLIVTLSIVMLGIMLINIFVMHNTFGFTNLAVIVVANTFLVWVMMIGMWLMAIYIARIHQEVQGRPLYIVKQKAGF